jgi:hypothetical protein
MQPVPHRIRRLSLRVKARSPRDALALRKDLRARIETALLPALGRAFDQIGASEAIVHIPKLEVHVAFSAEDEVAAGLASRVERELVRRWGAASGVARVLGSGPSPEPGALGTARNEPIRGQDASADGEGDAPLFSAPSDMLLHYLSTGSLPWPLASLDSGHVAAVLQDAAGAELEGIWDRLIPAGFRLADVAFWFRWLQLVPEGSWPAVARAAAARSSEQERAAWTELAAVLEGTDMGGVSRYVRLRLAAAAMAVVARTAGHGTNAGELASSVLDALRAAGDLPRSARDPDGVSLRDILMRVRLAGDASSDAPSVDAEAQALERTWPPHELLRPHFELTAAARARDALPGAAARAEPLGQNVRHAGLILLHPFLPRFFESTGIKQAGYPALLPSELPRAAALLHVLATGEEEVFEWDADFIKILLGLVLDAQLPVAEGLLVPSDRAEVEALLSAVVEHWRALKSTSVRGLQTSFLQRRGLVRAVDRGFRLQVEEAPFDMLLAQLPWGIGTVKLPWMNKAIFREWHTP